MKLVKRVFLTLFVNLLSNSELIWSHFVLFFIFDNYICEICLHLWLYFFLLVLQLKLQQRRTREELVSQGIMPRKNHFLLWSSVSGSFVPLTFCSTSRMFSWFVSWRYFFLLLHKFRPTPGLRFSSVCESK